VAIHFISAFDFKFYTSIYPQNKTNLDNWNIEIDLVVETNLISNTTATLDLVIEELNFFHTKFIVSPSDFKELSYIVNVNSKFIQLWWPSGYGEQQLYNLSLLVTLDGKTLSKSKLIGFRSIEIIEEPVSDDPSHGLSFYFRINNVDIFLKGSNWIPADSFQELIDERRFSDLLGSAVLANMNVMRVWGGGLYEKEEFYTLADQMGILIWQDFMFACSVSKYITLIKFIAVS
jgi:beta-mannosidase